MTTEKQIAANKNNAKKSTGPVSDEGKENSSQNSLKHAILSKELYFTTADNYLSKEQFVELQIAFYEELQPEGIIETMLVDRLFATFWRIQRLYIAETGAIKKQAEAHFMQNGIDYIEDNAVACGDIERGFFRRMRTSHGCDQLSIGWQAIHETIKEKGLPLSKGMTRALDEDLGGCSGYFKAEQVSYCNHVFRKIPEKPLSKKEKELLTEYALQYSKDMMEFLRAFSDCHRNDEEDLRKADLQSKMIPPAKELEKYQRYEAHLQRTMMQTLHELQRLQSLRLGSPAPLAAALDVTLNSENGFVS